MEKFSHLKKRRAFRCLKVYMICFYLLLSVNIILFLCSIHIVSFIECNCAVPTNHIVPVLRTSCICNLLSLYLHHTADITYLTLAFLLTQLICHIGTSLGMEFSLLFYCFIKAIRHTRLCIITNNITAVL